MMTYRVNEKNGTFEIIEKGTELIVAVRKVKDEAFKLARSLNLGSGFDGFTPPFFVATYADHTKGKATQT